MKSLFRGIYLVGLISVSLLLTGCLTGTIKGQVIDQYDRPVVGAIVTTDPPTQAVRTTQDGYVLRNVPTGEYVVEAEKPGFKSGKANVQVQWSVTTGADVQLERKE